MYKCRIFTKDIQTVQDVKDYTIKNKSFEFIVDGKGAKYKLGDTEYVIIPTTVFREMIEQIHINGQNTKNSNKSDRGKRAKLATLDEATEVSD